MKLLLIDGNSLVNRAYFALPPLNDDTGHNVNAVYGFVNLLFSAITQFEPTHLVVTFDAGGRNFRKDIYTEYKANRKGMADDLAQQMPVLQSLLSTMNVHYVLNKGTEADDIIGTLVRRFAMDCIVVTGDRDMLQLVDNNTSIALTKKGITDIDLVDASNIMQKYSLTASQIVDYKALRGDSSDNIPGVRGIGDKTALSLLFAYGDLDQVYNNIDNIKGAVQSKLLADKDMAYVSKRLATIVCDLDIPCQLQQCTLPVLDDSVKQRLLQLGFRSIVSRLPFVEEPIEQIDNTTIVVDNMVALQELVAKLAQCQCMAMEISPTNIVIAMEEHLQYLIMCSDSFLDPITHSSVLAMLDGVLSDDNINKALWDSKATRHLLSQYDIQLAGVQYDIALMQYLTEKRSAKNITELLDSLHLPSDTCSILTASTMLWSRLVAMDNVSLYQDVELPLATVLYDMEKCGVKVDKDMLDSISQEMKQQLAVLSQEIYSLAGEEFNISSPKQLSYILFEKLSLPHWKKTSTGYSTSSDVLAKLQDKHPIIDNIVQYRHVSKLVGTYIEGLRPLIVNNRVHTTYHGYLTTTGRLSSSEPNLQNIPIRTEQGRNIRKIFICTNGTFVGADYSQIELRLLASFSGDAQLLEAFSNGEDIHTKVASELMGVPMEMVNSNMRRMAKAVNFGIIYGISDFGLSENVGIAINKAHDYIQLYFQRFPTIKQYLDSSVDRAKADGYITTLLGRRRYIPEVQSSNRNLSKFGERAAMNMPLQGSAADIMKVAMIEVYSALKKQGLRSQLVLQIHDEIIVDAYPEEVELVKQIISDCMQNCVKLPCPLIADIEEGYSLYEA